ncbi:MAG: hypothetical protein DWQ06_14505 [Calditrichaeota bacterium]|nr:MAG: hypothetical protein DWQ06_14505 [Calditrichota bacterium]
MDNNIAISILSLIVGILVTVLVSRYYFLLSDEKSKKEIIPYIDFFYELLSGIDSEVREAVSIKYKDIEVEELIEVQFLILNSGAKPIRDQIKPLTLEIPKSSKIMNAALIYVSPKGREVVLEVDKKINKIKFLFNLLNKREFFVVKLLLNGKANIDDFKFKITVDDLPPELEAEYLPNDLIEGETSFQEPLVNWGLISGGFIFLLLGFSVGLLALEIPVELPNYVVSQPLIAYVSEIPLVWFAQWPCFILSILGILAGIIQMISGISVEETFKKKEKLKLPMDILRSKSLLVQDFDLNINNSKNSP